MKVGVIGAGTMGSGCPGLCRHGRFEVVLCDITEELAAGKNRITGSLSSLVSKKKDGAAGADAVLDRITTGLRDKVFDCDLVVEAALENMEVKGDFTGFRKSAKRTQYSPQHFLLSITEMSRGLDRGVVGMHSSTRRRS